MTTKIDFNKNVQLAMADLLRAVSEYRIQREADLKQEVRAELQGLADAVVAPTTCSVLRRKRTKSPESILFGLDNHDDLELIDPIGVMTVDDDDLRLNMDRDCETSIGDDV